jgi:hypothetical protein
MWGPSGALLRHFMEDDLSAQWGEGRSIEVKNAVEVLGGGESWVEAGGPE